MVLILAPCSIYIPALSRSRCHIFPLVAARLTCIGIGILACQPTTGNKRGNTGVYDYDDGSAGTRDIFTRKRLRGGGGWGGEWGAGFGRAGGSHFGRGGAV